MPSAAPADKEIARLAQDIQRYLLAHPHAADSVEGVLGWWLPRQRYEESAAKVQQALEFLAQRGAVTKRVLAGKVVYGNARTDTNNNDH